MTKCPGENSPRHFSDREDLLFLFFPALLPEDPQGTGQADGGIEAGHKAHDEGESEGDNGGEAVEPAHHRHHHHGKDGGEGGAGGTSQGLVHREIHQLAEGELLPQELAVFPDAVVDDDGGVNGVA